jgi:hypothetical protein
MSGIAGLLIMSIFGGGALMWLIYPTSIIFLPYYLRFRTLLVLFMGGWLGYEMAGFAFNDNLFSIYLYAASSFVGSMWFMVRGVLRSPRTTSLGTTRPSTIFNRLLLN